MQVLSRTHLLVVAGLALILLAGVAAVVAFESGRDHADVILSTEIDERTGAPLNSVDFVPAGVTRLYAAVAIENASAGQHFRFEWRGGADQLETEHELPADVEAGWVFSALENADGLQPGDGYRVEVFRDGDRIAKRDFQVTR